MYQKQAEYTSKKTQGIDLRFGLFIINFIFYYENDIIMKSEVGIDCSNSEFAKKGFEELAKHHMITERFLNEVKDVLSISDKEDITFDDVVEAEEGMEKLKSSLDREMRRGIISSKKTLLKILSFVPSFTNKKYIKSKLWFDYHLLELVSQDTDDWKCFIFKDIFDIIHFLNADEIEILWDMNSEKYVDVLKKICEKFLDSDQWGLFLSEPRSLNDDFIKNLREELYQKYPNVWSSNFVSIRYSNKTEQKFRESVRWYIMTKIKNYINTNKDQYQDSWSFMKHFLIFFNDLLNDWFEREYHDFMNYYMHDLYKGIDARKAWPWKKHILSASKRLQEDRDQKENPTSHESKENKCSQKTTNFLNNFIDSLDTLHKEKSLIRSYILRLHLKWKSIRIRDMIQNFPITTDLFTEEFINQAKEVWLIFENWIHKVVDETPKSQTENASVKINEDKIQVENDVKIAFEKRVDYFIKNTKSFDWQWFVELMSIAKYNVGNGKYLAKTFDKLYKKDCNMKLLFLNDIKQNIYIQEKISHMKECYRKINLHNSYRILFLVNQKTIDGIYNHTEYEKRIDSKVF